MWYMYIFSLLKVAFKKHFTKIYKKNVFTNDIYIDNQKKT